MTLSHPLVLELSVLCLGIFLLVVESFSTGGHKRLLAHLGIIGLGVVFALTFFIQPGLGDSSFYTTDKAAIFFKQFSLLCTIIVLAMSVDYEDVVERNVPGVGNGAGVGEFFALPVFACAGLMWMVSAVDFIMIFVSLELVTISFYVMVAYMRKNRFCLEAGTKYLILGALSTGFIVYGIAWIFGVTGQTSLPFIADLLPSLPATSRVALLFGLGLVIISLGFKVGAFPFQFWIPDVYQGAPTPIAAFLSVASKAAGFVVLLRVVYCFIGVPEIAAKLLPLLAVLAGATLIFGNLAAIPQTNLKRLLAYSSVGHAGYLLMALASITSGIAAWAIGFYLAGYLLMTLLAFTVMIVVSNAVGGEEISDFNGLSRRSPWLAFAMLVAMLSLAGIPFTAGFLGKFFIFEAALISGQYVLIALGVITVGAGFYYYLKVVRAMYWQPAPDEPVTFSVSINTRIAIAVLAILIFFVGIYPQAILSALQSPDARADANRPAAIK